MERRHARALFVCVAFASCCAVGMARQSGGQTAPPPGNRPQQAPAQGQQPGQPGQPGQRGPGGPGGRGPGQQVSVGGAMKAMNRAAKSLQGQITDAAKKDENLRFLDEMERACAMAKGQPIPADVLEGAKTDEEKTKWSLAFRTKLMASMRLMLDMEQDVLDGKGADARAKLEKLDALRDESHQLMGVKDDDEQKDGAAPQPQPPR